MYKKKTLMMHRDTYMVLWKICTRTSITKFMLKQITQRVHTHIPTMKKNC